MTLFSRKKILLLPLGLAIWVYLAYRTSLGLSELQSLQHQYIELYRSSPGQTIALFFIAYLGSTALSLPVASLLTIAAGATFGFGRGLLVVSFASTLGATLAFAISRLFLRDWIQKRFAKQLETVKSGIETQGSFYLFALRLSPIFPFFLVNFLFGLTPMSVVTFYWISQVGMLPGTALYVNAGAQLSNITSLKNILTPSIIISLTLTGIFPFAVKRLVKKIKNPEQS